MRGYSDYRSCWMFLLLIVRAFFSYVSELVYIHSKVMIVDDRRVIVINPFLLQVFQVLTLDHIDGIGEHQRA
jgi:hypothetical protein